MKYYARTVVISNCNYVKVDFYYRLKYYQQLGKPAAAPTSDIPAASATTAAAATAAAAATVATEAAAAAATVISSQDYGIICAREM